MSLAILGLGALVALVGFIVYKACKSSPAAAQAVESEAETVGQSVETAAEDEVKKL